MQPENLAGLNIAAVERETGFSKDVLRKWETRYGFPAPTRDHLGERVYPPAQVNRLCLIKRLMDSGLRPSRVVGLNETELQELARARQAKPWMPAQDEAISACLGLLRNQPPEAIRRALRRKLLRQGIERFVLDTLTPLNVAVGEAWARGDLAIHQEHVYSEAVQWLLRDAVASLADAQGRPRVLLTTLPDEQHGLGILMLAALFSLRGANCISLGTQTPVNEVVRAALAHQADVIGLSFSIAYPPRRVQPAVTELAQQLNADIEIWAGGAGTERMGASDTGAHFLPTLEQALAALEVWQSTHQPG
jgi:methylmalonyl-CoA mutase cobalamin-binding subunit/DNA-binding transcriptional MerR regulator